MQKVKLIALTLLASSARASHEYLYPVAAYKTPEGASKLFLLYQKSPAYIELWEWDPITKHANKALPASYTPAGVRMLSDNSGFSFIDEDRIRIKKFTKRSAKTLDISEPLHSLGPVTWAEDGTGYFHAQGKKNFSIFGVTVDADLSCIAVGEGDCMYPSKAGSHLFYIERSQDTKKTFDDCFHLKPSAVPVYSYKLCSVPYPQNPRGHDAQADSGHHAQVLIDFGTQPVGFLQMVSPERGFIIEHPPVVDNDDKEIIFLVHELYTLPSGDWKYCYRFSFHLPTSLLLSPDCLYETMLPLLPLYYEGNLYYADIAIGHTGPCHSGYGDAVVPRLYCQTGTNYTFTRKCSEYRSFAPVPCDGTIYFGGSLRSEGGPRMAMDETDEVVIEMPSIKN